MRDLKRSASFLLFGSAIWTLAMVMFVFFRYWDGNTIYEWEVVQLIGTKRTIILTALGGFISGIILEILELYLFSPLFRRIPTPFTIIIKSIIQFIILTLYAFFIIWMFNRFQTIDWDMARGHFEYSTLLPFMLYIFCTIFFLSLLRLLYRLIGPLNFSSVLWGKYDSPREEERIFMFVDLNSSTEIAERLGNKKVSRLIQECFNDLSRISLDFKAHTYQYVGDEVVLTWASADGFVNARCLDLFFAFQEKLIQRKKFYKRKFGFIPKFKCSLHVGKVIATQVGLVKTEIAFHGNVVNTTSRIMEKCHHYGEEFLISGEIFKKVHKEPDYLFTELGSADLRGKDETIFLYGVRRSEEYSSKLEEIEEDNFIF